MSFYIDDELVGTFTKNGLDLEDDYEYNVPVYVNESLPHTAHTLKLVNGLVNGQPGVGETLVLLDKLMYTCVAIIFYLIGLTFLAYRYDDGILPNANETGFPSPTDSVSSSTSAQSETSNSSPILRIAIAVPLAVIVFLFGLGLIWFFMRRARSRRSRQLTSWQRNGIEPFQLGPVPVLSSSTASLNQSHSNSQSWGQSTNEKRSRSRPQPYNDELPSSQGSSHHHDPSMQKRRIHNHISPTSAPPAYHS
jgi:hypothetical protein